MNQKDILTYIDTHSGSPMYQTIIYNNKVIRQGTEGCPITWSNILKTGIIFKDKVIYDLGCFNGYFSFKVEECGAKEIIGIDNNKPALDISNILAISNNSKCKYKNITMGKDIIFDRKVDIVLVLNVIHHVKRIYGLEIFLQVLNDIFNNATEIIFEVNDVEIQYIEEISKKYNFILKDKIKSHRNTMFGQRYVLYYIMSI